MPLMSALRLDGRQPLRRGGDRLGRNRADGTIGRDVLANAGNRAMGRNLAVETTACERFDQGVEIGGRDPIAIAIVDLQARRFGARCLAFGVFESEHPVAAWCCRP